MTNVDSGSAARAGARILNESEVRSLIGRDEALAAVREAFTRMGRGETMLPPAMFIWVPEHEGEVHVKGAHVVGAANYAVKFASVFERNPEKHLAAVTGMVLTFSAETGYLSGMLMDNGYLTDLRTGAAGALAADLLAREDVEQAAVIGAGIQGRYQLEALLGVRQPQRVRIFDIDAAAAEAYAAEMSRKTGLPVTVAASVQEALEGSGVVVGTTPAQAPHTMLEWVEPGTHYTAMGSDNPHKQELDPRLLAAAGKLVVDSREMCAVNGELHHALDSGLMTEADVHAELGEVAAGLRPGRTSDDEITVCDLTGLGIQDTAVADFVMRRAIAAGTGREVDSLP